MACRPTGTATVGPVGSPSSSTVVSGGSAASLICASVSVTTLIVEVRQRRKPGPGDVHGEARDVGEIQRQGGQRVDGRSDPPGELGVQAG